MAPKIIRKQKSRTKKGSRANPASPKRMISTELKSRKNYFFFLAAFLTAFFAAFFGAFLAAFFLVAMCGSPPSGWVQIKNVEQNKTGNRHGYREKTTTRNARVYWLSRDP
jgi:hypothetical protein